MHISLPFSYCCSDLNGALLVKSCWDLCISDSVRQEEKAFNEGCLREIPRKKLDFGARVCVCVCFCRAVNLCLFPSSMSWDMFSYFVLTQFWAKYDEPTSPATNHGLLRESPQTFPNHAV